VLVSTSDQLAAALALIELDGIARRLVLCPSDFDRAHLPYVSRRRKSTRLSPTPPPS